MVDKHITNNLNQTSLSYFTVAGMPSQVTKCTAEYSSFEYGGLMNTMRIVKIAYYFQDHHMGLLYEP